MKKERLVKRRVVPVVILTVLTLLFTFLMGIRNTMPLDEVVVLFFLDLIFLAVFIYFLEEERLLKQLPTEECGINDSKKLTEKKREALFDEIIEKALAYKIVFVGPEIIDRDNILNATMGGMRQAVEELDIVPNLVLIDGNRTPAGLTMPAQPVVKGDATSASIGAASVLAKVSRDRYMLELDRQYPQYQLAKHKGYPTKLHYELIAQYGIQPFYRRSFLKKQGYWPEGK